MENTAIETAGAIESRAHFIAETAVLHGAANYLSRRIVQRRNTLPILSCIRIDARPDGALSLAGHNLDQSGAFTLSAEIDAPGALCVDAFALRDALGKAKKAKCESVTLEHTDADCLIIKAGRARFTLKTLPVDDFPHPIGGTWSELTLSAEFSADAGTMAIDMEALRPCMSKKDNRYYLEGVAMQARTLGGRDRLALVALDGSNLAASARPLPAGAQGLPDCIIPGAAIDALAWALKGDKESESVRAAISADGKFARFQLGALSIETRTIDATYPDWQSLFAAGAALCPTDETGDALFPDLLPGIPTGAMERLGKGCKVGAIEWQDTFSGMLGAVPGDPALIFGAMKTRSNPAKGFAYEWGGQDKAKAYLVDLAANRGMLSADAMRERVEAAKADLGEVYSPYNRYGQKSVAVEMIDTGTLQTVGGRIVGMTVAARLRHYAWQETVKCWESLSDKAIEHPERVEAVEGSYSILMPADGPQMEAAHSVTVEGDRTYPIAVNSGGSKCHLTKEQVAALCGDDLWDVIEFTGQDGAPRYVSKWLFDDGASRLLCLGADGRCPDADARREYVTREAVEAALAGDPAPIEEMKASEPEKPPVSDESPAAPALTPEPADIEPSEPETAGEGQNEPCSDPMEAMLARLAAIEERLANLPAEPEIAPSGEIEPAMSDDPRRRAISMAKREIEAEREAPAKRSPAHERAIRRAWSERKARRLAMAGYNRMGEALRDARKRAEDLEGDNRRLAIAAEHASEAAANADARRLQERAKRARFAARGRRMLDKARAQREDLRAAYMTALGEVNRLRRDMADPSQPERASDIAQLVHQRDEARNANAALRQRCERQEAALNTGADAIEAMGLRLARAEASLRKLDAA